MVKYMSTIRLTAEPRMRFFISFNSSFFGSFLVSPGRKAWYPASSTAAISAFAVSMLSSSACMVPASRFTSAVFTPGTARLTFSTRAEQAAQVMPVTVNVSFIRIPPCVYYRPDWREKQ